MGLLVLAAAIGATALSIWIMSRLFYWIARKMVNRKELRKAWHSNQKIDITLRWEMPSDLFHLLVRKKRWRLFKDKGWKYVNIYAGGDLSLKPNQDEDPDYNWIHVTWVPGTFNQFKEYELLQNIKTYQDLANYYDLGIARYKRDKSMS